MANVTLTATGVTKFFNRRKIFTNIAFTLHQNNSLAIMGRNGSGKSTLVKILAGVLSPTNGKVELRVDGKDVPANDRNQFLGFVSPYLQMYDEFTGWENLDFYRRVRGIQASGDTLIRLINRVSLFDRKDDFVRTYSSGMKQRLKYAFALLHQPSVLFLDEPTSNLDAEGIVTIYQIMEEQKQKGILIVATNDAVERDRCDQLLDLNSISPTMVAA